MRGLLMRALYYKTVDELLKDVQPRANSFESARWVDCSCGGLVAEAADLNTRSLNSNPVG